MKYCLAPLEGNTTYTFRMAYHKNYGGMDRYFTPFIASRKPNSRELNDILPEHNVGMTVIPQILTNKSDEFLDIAAFIAEYGYDTVNLNLGCPAATVVTRRRGSGMLVEPADLEVFLDEIFTKCPLKISVKTRIGIEDVNEWERILDVYAKFPLEELIIHPRLQKQGYGGQVHLDTVKAAFERGFQFPICYNGDITDLTEGASGYGTIEWLSEELPAVDRVMIGRGIFSNPGMVAARLSKEAPDTVSPLYLADKPLETLKNFHNDLLQGYLAIMSGDANTLFKMKDLWNFLSNSFVDCDKHLKKIRKATHISDYEIAVKNLMRECEFKY